MQRLPIAIWGATGYVGTELVHLLEEHPGARICALANSRDLEQATADPTRSWQDFPGLSEPLKRSQDAAVLFLATPAEVSLRLLSTLTPSAKQRVIDLSGAFRLRDAKQYAHVYGFMHTAPELLLGAVYGLPELFPAAMQGAHLVANPGCYATCAALAAAPLIRRSLIEPELIIDAASGSSGAGKQSAVEMSFSEVFGDYRAYKVLRHQHTPEIAQTLAALAHAPVRVTFTPHLLPVARGILVTLYGKLSSGVGAGDVFSAFAEHYAQAPFVEIVDSPEQVTLTRVVNSNRCSVGIAICEEGLDAGRVVVVAAIDNLQKGAAGQAVQNFNLMTGWPETTGLRGFKKGVR